MAVAATTISLLEPAERHEFAGAMHFLLRRALRHVPLLAVVGLVIGIHVPTMSYFFFGDDFLVLGDIESRSFTAYVRDVVALRDSTPNWRPLTMLVYWAEFKLFGFDAMAWRIVNLSFHAGTVVVLYALVLSITKRIFVALAAALIFGVSASAVHTVTYITAFPHVFSQFLMLLSLLTLHRYVESGERRWGWYWASLLLFIAGFLANEGGVVIGGVIFVYFAAFSLARRRDVLDFAIKMTPFGIAAALLVSGLSGCGCQGVDAGFYGVGWHMPRETWIYMSRLAYPVGSIALEPSAMEWAWGSVVVGFAIFFFVRGPNIARFAAAGMLLGVMPYVPGKIWTATRYTYMSLPFFAILVAVAAGFVHHYASRFYKPAAHVLAAGALAAVGGLYAWQTMDQTRPFVRETQRWELLVTELQRTYDRDDVSAGTTIYIVDDEGRWSNAYWGGWLQSVGHAMYGKDVTLRALPADQLAFLQRSLDAPALFVRLDDGRLVEISADAVTLLGIDRLRSSDD